MTTDRTNNQKFLREWAREASSERSNIMCDTTVRSYYDHEQQSIPHTIASLRLP